MAKALIRTCLAFRQDGEFYHDYVGRGGLEHLRDQLSHFAV